MWKRATLFWGDGHRNRLATWSQFMSPFCFLRVGSWWANHSLLVVWFTGFGNSVSRIQGFSSKTTYISLGLVHEILGLKSLKRRKHHFGSQSLVFMERLLYHVTCSRQSSVFPTSTWPWTYYRTPHPLWPFPEDKFVSGFIGDFILTGFFRKSVFFKSRCTPALLHEHIL